MQHSSLVTRWLADTAENKKDVGFLAFLRLIGTLYFKKHYSALVSLKGSETPQQLFHACCEQNLREKHLEWYQAIRAIVSDRITCEQERMPSHSSMWRHWLRSCWSCWISRMWSNSAEDNIQLSLPPPEECGWKKTTDDTYIVDWECPAVQQQVQDTINFLTKGCSCKKGCLSQRCGCVKGGHHCGPGCSCQNCKNASTSDTREIQSPRTESDPREIQSPLTELDRQTESDSESNSESETTDEDIETEIITNTLNELDF